MWSPVKLGVDAGSPLPGDPGVDDSVLGSVTSSSVQAKVYTAPACVLSSSYFSSSYLFVALCHLVLLYDTGTPPTPFYVAAAAHAQHSTRGLTLFNTH